MFDKVLIANRGAIACRVMRTLKRMDIKSVAVYSEADRYAKHVLDADEAFCLGPAPVQASYLNADQVIKAAQATGAQAIHPGYGFLSENPAFVEACDEAGLTFIGPTAEQMRAFGLKHAARELAQSVQVPLCPGTGLIQAEDEAIHAAEEIGYPLMVKSTAGGGGIGIRLVRKKEELIEAISSVKMLGKNNFGDSGLFIEKYIERARHIEVQIFGDGKGSVIALGERDCSTQRRNQKVIEECPAPRLSDNIRAAMCDAAVKLGQTVSYRNAGTVEFIYDDDTEAFYFLEVNARLQVEHGVTEEVYKVDLVEFMVKQAAGELEPLDHFGFKPEGSAIEVRIYAENPSADFRPSAGKLTLTHFPESLRCETWVESGSDITAFYDPMIAKIISYSGTREQSIQHLKDGLQKTKLHGIETNKEYLIDILQDATFVDGKMTTTFLKDFIHHPHTVEVLQAGTMTLVVDYPGRLGYWAVGVPPSGPMDHYALRLGNRMLGNEESAPGLEMTITGCSLKFNTATHIVLTGAFMEAKLDDEAIEYWKVVSIKPGQILKIGKLKGAGARAYLTIKNGWDVPEFMGSCTTFSLGQFGGHGGRPLQATDVLHLQKEKEKEQAQVGVLENSFQTIDSSLIPSYSNSWEIGVLYGPHGAPDFFTDEDIEMFFSTDWEIHYNSDRTGIRLIGPKPTWARKDGGEAGLHPSNIHDNAYAVGTIDFTGDMPIILGQDGPSLGGFVCPAVVVQAELWKLGQLKAGDAVRFIRWSYDEACAREEAQNKTIQALSMVTVERSSSEQKEHRLDEAVIHQLPEKDLNLSVVYRGAGDKYVLVEYGPMALDMNIRFRVHALMEYLQKLVLPGIIDLTPGIRSLQIHFDNGTLPLKDLMDLLVEAEHNLPSVEDMEVSSRLVHLPLAWNDDSIQKAIDHYSQSVRQNAPWCPSNIEFIRRINGLNSIDDVYRIFFDASYMVLGLGDVYLGAPVATPIDPRHRLVTTKYNPARTWTPENAVGIGGAYLCIYGMEGPGGYQLCGRTIQVWNTYKQTADFKEGKPWLLRFFDQLRFYPVSHDELMQIRSDFPQGQFKLKVEEKTFSLKDYNAFLKDNAQSISEFKTTQQKAFIEERERWVAAGQNIFTSVDPSLTRDHDNDCTIDVPENGEEIPSVITGNVWKIEVEEGQVVDEGDTIIIVEAMKMETRILAPFDGTIHSVHCEEGKPIQAGQTVTVLIKDKDKGKVKHKETKA
ncbi:MAG: urea carboxylase [Verrucomicrobiota bacterium]